MPLISSNYNPPLLFKHGHFSTIYSGLFRKVEGLKQERERIQLSDGDFLDLDWSYYPEPTKKVAIIIHGLEGDAKRAYIKGAAKILSQNDFDVCALNLRGCSGSPNILYRSYHSGATEDLNDVVHHILEMDRYEVIYLYGFSLGGNLLLKYLGESRLVPKEVHAAVAISVPCQLGDSLEQLLQFKNVLYAKRFKGNLIDKLKIKKQLFPDKISNSEIKQVKTLKDFDNIYTSKAHGFTDAMDYYSKSSCLQFLPSINIPCLIVNAQNDTFLGQACYPYNEAEKNKNIFLEVPEYGGHVGFYGRENKTYTERRSLEFLKEIH
ncbi:alpha/beta fold hydrolase [Maribacter sp. PR1]|uniref:Alpha/beta fold hydrolase n=1 Tax=Maribacter cobaltidurans TaxID=1178778 RepID=A0ABU7IR78_9FLAO|nr:MULTISPECIES: alpha/beta fold hydrolase [Maribacter]MDC6388069.1 alpha/beta fold hydrolase [Maribacter sp. PR1]MEE1975457.1 alpha/beta fold hydrolase [Maribacter cobaltidurans]